MGTCKNSLGEAVFRNELARAMVYPSKPNFNYIAFISKTGVYRDTHVLIFAPNVDCGYS